MSMLWALTGSVDPRPFQDAKVSDVVNDASKVGDSKFSGVFYVTFFRADFLLLLHRRQ